MSSCIERQKTLFFTVVSIVFVVCGGLYDRQLFAYTDVNATHVQLLIMGCNNNYVCDPGLGETVGSCPLDCTIATTTPPTVSNIPSGGPTGGGSGGTGSRGVLVQDPFTIGRFLISVSTSTATINWSTSRQTVSIISWGKGPDLELGSISENSPRFDHIIKLKDLQPESTYYLSISATMVSGQNRRIVQAFTTSGIQDEQPPSSVTNFKARPSFGGNILLSWNNPMEFDFTSVKITRGTKFFPTSPDQGYVVYEGNGVQALDTNTVPGKYYFYSAFSRDNQFNYSAPAIAGFSYGQAVSPSPFTPSQEVIEQTLFGGKTLTGSTTLKDILFYQNNIPAYRDVTDVGVRKELAVSIRIPAKFVPKNAQQAMIMIYDDIEGESSFMFIPQVDGSLRATIPAFILGNKIDFSIILQSPGSETHIRGTFLVRNDGLNIAKISSAESSEIPIYYYVAFVFISVAFFLFIMRRRRSR